VKCEPKVPKPRLFLDTSALFAAVFSPVGGARELLRLSEMGAITLLVGPRVLAEAEEVFQRKAPDLLSSLAVLLARANVELGPSADQRIVARMESIIAYAPDARILAEALAAESDFFVTHDRAHFLDIPHVLNLACQTGSLGDALDWLRRQLASAG
jgi:predicted nucleic acid-binding protein